MNNNLRKGRVRLKRDFGFVEFEEEGIEDIRLSRADLGAAMDGDTVMVRSVMHRGRREGRVEEVLERAREQIVGTIDVRRGEPVLVTQRATEPVRLVFDKIQKRDCRAGILAIAEISAFPSVYASAKAKVIKLLGPAGDPATELEASRISHHVPHDFPANVVREAASIPDKISEDDLAGRFDLRNLATFTIDPTDARDFDDAISIEPYENGYRLGVHIADVAHYIHEGSFIDREAYRRATSTYLPGHVIPMLPERLSNGICSLVEGQDRLTVTVFTILDSDFIPTGYSHGRSVIRSNRRFTYDDVDQILDSGQGDFTPELALLKKIAQKFYRARIDRGAIDFEMPEKKPILDLQGRVVDVRTIERTWSHRLIEELMIHANEYVARTMRKRGIYRVHEPPSPEKMMRLRKIASTIGKASARGSLQAILERFRESPARRVIEYLVLRSMQEAHYSHQNVGHYGLASDAYSHFTSPIRRYPDLIAHRLILGDKTELALEDAGRHTSRREREAMEAERDALTIKMLEFAESKLGEKVMGVIDHITRDGLFLTLEMGPRGHIPTSELGREDFQFDRDSLSMVGRRTRRRFALGDRLETTIANVDFGSRTLYLSLGDARPRESERRPPKRGKAKKQKYRQRRR